MDLLNNYTIPESGLILSDSKDPVCVDMPRTLDTPPSLENSMLNTNYFREFTDKDRKEWYDLLFSEKADIVGVNGVRISLNEDIWCGYCHENMNEDGDYCYHCHRYICKSCVEFPNNRLKECRKHNLIRPSKYLYLMGHLDYSSNPMRCNKCEDGVGYYQPFWAKQSSGFLEKPVDILCNKCGEAPYIYRENKIESYDRSDIPYFQGEFGSILDWIPLFTDNVNYDEFAVFINLNPDSLLYKKIALRTYDDHGRIGFFVLYDYTLDSLLNKMIELENIHNENPDYLRYPIMDDGITRNCSGELRDDLENWTPLKQIVIDLELNYYYG
jgi:hypothetical protein